ncbi:DUF2905 domain-containing protein [Paenibacillus thailandensis]|uniref:DUF2905 domain-containing protein n=1 Tax=Paenibacillus thailandensis TaxID=393250 RepID=A0ABW5QXJ9_9BACL
MNIAKYLIIAGAALTVIGVLWAVIGKYIPLGRLPGDIAVEKGNVKFYFPIVTCIVISVVLSLIGYIVRWFSK